LWPIMRQISLRPIMDFMSSDGTRYAIESIERRFMLTRSAPAND
jgi:hypothetical protein